MRLFALLCLLTLAACATPRQACERNAMYDLMLLDRLVLETEQTLARGYALEREPYRRTSLEMCYGRGFGDDGSGLGFVWCNRPDIGFRERPVAVDLRAERQKLADLRAKRREVARDAARAMAACRARYPEG
ncbi:hypothetical protein SAMN05444722_3179 [Rhodovulum sp. ES.010]|uniref:hypothetical protein n=1 Tax=Rhodovulum sp. ES.010 TaxID=1882821 RepID=UPI000927E46A|nr:hypothetical protein [Rhodovulum sp. ES.010]SIO53180.1 hypothetical protein SAMN05444722_3179 [Rhodovulum sp. ES.010]